MIAEVECSGISWQVFVSETPIRAGERSAMIFR